MSTDTLIFVLGDQLDHDSAALDDLTPRDAKVVMAEVEAEVFRHQSHRQRIVFFLSAMRHYRDELRDEGWTVDYLKLDSKKALPSLPEFIADRIDRHEAKRVVMVEPGRYGLREEIREAIVAAGAELDLREDRSFYTTHEQFEMWAKGRKSLVMETFYRQQRKNLDILMTGDGKPRGGSWNFDKDNRESLPNGGLPEKREPPTFEPDEITERVIRMVSSLGDDDQRLHGEAEGFSWPVTREQALQCLDEFVADALPLFGTYQDAMWHDEPILYHARLSPMINLKLLHPKEVVDRVLEALEDGRREVEINAVEGFVRQLIGWREFMRGVYWLEMPGYAGRNTLGADRELPPCFWTGETEMNCIKQTVQGLLDRAWAHHIQRLMVTGLFAQLYGTHPREVHEWYMAYYVDSVEWVTMPNVIGMSQYADGGIIGTKPYVATGKYIERMSNYCDHCRYDPGRATGDDACPFTTLYWDFLARHRNQLSDNVRMRLQLANLDRKREEELTQIRSQASRVRRAVEKSEL